MTEYNGHPSYEHWNVALWVGNDEYLYKTATAKPAVPTAFSRWLSDVMPVTPDGVEVTEDLARYAWECVNE